ncbi:transient receptor potential cation channel subfamily V member 5-like [Haliotis rufescens]|uniref:transient receptor potential cation channel subfamily V member 5-like n=1 Tax=Haliotis rufescens TaxID=6454 RepID=UPI00201FA65B|nr:transient receptor potential cation channel subfamily V member 5-like [Haliotis rufescens]
MEPPKLKLNSTPVDKQRLAKTLNLDNDMRILLYALIDPGNPDSESCNLELKSATQGTLLHCITRATVTHPEQIEVYMKLFDEIESRCVAWWCRKQSIDVPEDDRDSYRIYKCKAMEYLTMTVKVSEQDEMSVWDLAFDLVSVEVLQKLLKMTGVTYVKDSSGRCRYQISTICPKFLHKGQTGFLHSVFGIPHKDDSRFERLLNKSKEVKRVAEVLEMQPFKEIANIYISISTKIHLFIAFLHILYMALFSYGCWDVMESMMQRNTTTPQTATEVFVVGVTEPVCLTIYVASHVVKSVITRSEEDRDSGYYVRVFFRINNLIFYIILLSLSITSLSPRTNTNNYFDRNILISVTLLYGWLMTFTLVKGIKSAHFFFRATLRIIYTDVRKLILVYVIILMGFSMAMHILFMGSPIITSIYRNPFFTIFMMFNTMLGVVEMFTDDIEHGLNENLVLSVFCRIVYIVYIVLSSIILINLLIAMMNTSYSQMRQHHSNLWKLEAVKFGIKTERILRNLTPRWGTTVVKYGNMFPKSLEQKYVWYIELPVEDARYGKRAGDSPSLESTLESLDVRGAKFATQLAEMRNSLDNIKGQMDSIHKQLLTMETKHSDWV